MTLIEALKAINSPSPPGASPFRIALCCGFTPLHFETFLKAHAVLIYHERAVTAHHGLFGDLAGNLERLDPAQSEAAIVPIEWADLDPRLGLRSAGRWDPDALSDIQRAAHMELQRIAVALRGLASLRVVVSLPTLPLPPIAYTGPDRLSSFEANLRCELAAFSHSISCLENIHVIASQAVDRASPFDRRFDVKSELLTGFPYSLEHADALSRLLAAAIEPPTRKKGLITDLDDTLWRGILGETGPDGVCWSLDERAQIHGIYQQFLNSLAGSGTLLGVASKNDPALVAEAFERQDLLAPKERFFPVEAHWGPKSPSVARILSAWNISADSVVFVDDSPMELAEVQAAFPSIECVLFPKDDPHRFWEFLFAMRAKFGVAQLTREDSLRADSLRARERFEQERQDAPADGDSFLRAAEAEITLAEDKGPDTRAFELINKTNQFNLNGRRISAADWSALLADPHSFVLKVSYRDRFGPLGTIAVLVGTAHGKEVAIEHWVMSCRAFSRRIEHRCLEQVFDRFDASDVLLQFAPTPRNGPAHDFLAGFLGHAPKGPERMTRSSFQKNCPPLYHLVRDKANDRS